MSETITAIHVAKAIKKQMDLGFTHPEEIKQNLSREGFTAEEVDAYLSGKNFQRSQGATKYILIGVGLIIIGLILIVTAGAVFGELRFSFRSHGDIRRWKELVLQPLAGFAAIVLGIVAIVRRRPIPFPALSIPFIILSALLALSDLILNGLGMLLFGGILVALVVLLTKKPKA